MSLTRGAEEIQHPFFEWQQATHVFPTSKTIKKKKPKNRPLIPFSFHSLYAQTASDLGIAIRSRSTMRSDWQNNLESRLSMSDPLDERQRSCSASRQP